MENKKLTRLREKEKWTLTDLSREAKVSWRTVQKAEAGLQITRICQVKIAAAFNLTPERLF